MPVGIGFDIHRLVPGRKLVLGGVEIDHPLGLLGHSDGDVLLHAVIDALLGAAAKGDIGSRFPDTDPTWKDAVSEGLLRKVAEELRPGWKVVNIDVTVLAELPKIGPHRETICAKVAAALGIPASSVNVKAKTMEGLGAVGAREAMAAMATAELQRR